MTQGTFTSIIGFLSAESTHFFTDYPDRHGHTYQIGVGKKEATKSKVVNVKRETSIVKQNLIPIISGRKLQLTLRSRVVESQYGI